MSLSIEERREVRDSDLGDEELRARCDMAAPPWGLTAIEDQQLGGLIMWVGASTFY